MTNSKQTWEDRFYKFSRGLCIGFLPQDGDEKNLYLSNIQMGFEELEFFISQELTKAREEERERIVNEVGKLKRYNAAFNGIPAAYMTDDWYNQALRDVVDLLSSNQKK